MNECMTSSVVKIKIFSSIVLYSFIDIYITKSSRKYLIVNYSK